MAIRIGKGSSVVIAIDLFRNVALTVAITIAVSVSIALALALTITVSVVDFAVAIAIFDNTIFIAVAFKFSSEAGEFCDYLPSLYMLSFRM